MSESEVTVPVQRAVEDGPRIPAVPGFAPAGAGRTGAGRRR